MTPILLAVALGQTILADKIVLSAKDQLTWKTKYDPSYVKLSYPGGDVPKTKGVCTDVVIRSLRSAGYDLQKLVHEDMKKAWKLYPRYSGIKAPDKNIDHRRVKNLRVFFGRFGQTLTNDPKKTSEWKPGDIVTWDLGNGLDHIGVLVNDRGSSGYLEIVHNIAGTAQEDSLTSWKITGHYRYPIPKAK